MAKPWQMEKIAKLQKLREMFNFSNPLMDCEKLQGLCENSDAYAFAKDYSDLHDLVMEFKAKYPQVYN